MQTKGTVRCHCSYWSHWRQAYVSVFFLIRTSSVRKSTEKRPRSSIPGCCISCYSFSKRQSRNITLSYCLGPGRYISNNYTKEIIRTAMKKTCSPCVFNHLGKHSNYVENVDYKALSMWTWRHEHILQYPDFFRMNEWMDVHRQGGGHCIAVFHAYDGDLIKKPFLPQACHTTSGRTARRRSSTPSSLLVFAKGIDSPGHRGCSVRKSQHLSPNNVKHLLQEDWKGPDSVPQAVGEEIMNHLL